MTKHLPSFFSTLRILLKTKKPAHDHAWSLKSPNLQVFDGDHVVKVIWG